MIRLLHIPERHCVIFHPVPFCHSKNSLIRIYEDFDKAKEAARLLLDCQEKREKWLYSLGYREDPHFTSKENWVKGSEARVGRRIMDRNID